jgi:hypothetical protein
MVSAGSPAPFLLVTHGSCFWGKRKDCDFGYAPAVHSCEGVYDPDTCTVAVLDATTAFAVSNPSFLSQD